MNRTLRVIPLGLLIGLALNGCAAQLSGLLGNAGSIGNVAGGISGQLDDTINMLILQKAQAIHNLTASLNAINAIPGPVMMTMPGPVITPMPPSPPATPTPPGSLPPVIAPSPTAGSPIVTPNARLHRRVRGAWPEFNFANADSEP